MKSQAQLRIRLPQEIKDWLESEAARNLRTMNAELVVLLREKMAASTTADTRAAT
jgi:hypothetical protein